MSVVMKSIFIGIYLLTVFDAAATAIGIKQGYLNEANPLLRELVSTMPAVSCTCLCLLVGLFLLFLYRLRNRIRWLGYALSAILLVKMVVFGMHLQIFFKIL